MNNEMWQQLNENEEKQKSCCSLNRKSKTVLIIVLSIVALIGIAVLTVLLVLFFKDDKEIINSNDLNITLIAEVFPDGQRLTAIGINFISKDNPDQEYIIDNSKLNNKIFTVQERNITNIHSSTSLKDPHQTENGKYIIIELNPKDPGAPLIYEDRENNFQGRKNVTIHVQQQLDIELINGKTISKSSRIYKNDPDINKSINIIVDEFITKQYINSTNPNETLSYNLYVPKSLRNQGSTTKNIEKYPLILFMHDASIKCNDTRMTLFQGVGGTIWATNEEQLKRETFIVAPCFNHIIVGGNYEHTGQYSYIIPMLEDLINNQYKDKIDINRLYTTGQSMGCMTSISLMCEYPGYFASGMLVAGQWDVKIMEALLNQSFWILCSEADMRAPAQNDKAMDNLEKLGARISRARWYGNATKDDMKRNVEDILKEGNDKMYVKFINHTVMPDDIPYDPADEHMYTWKVAYLIDGVRDWLFSN